jgi:hypothetical protein
MYTTKNVTIGNDTRVVIYDGSGKRITPRVARDRLNQQQARIQQLEAALSGIAHIIAGEMYEEYFERLLNNWLENIGWPALQGGE